MAFSGSIGELIAVLGAGASAASTGLSIANAVKGSPKPPAPLQGAKTPTADAFRRSNAGAFSPGAAMASAFGQNVGVSSLQGSNTLLGQ